MPGTPMRASALRGRGDPKVPLAAVEVFPFGNGKGNDGGAGIGGVVSNVELGERQVVMLSGDLKM